jgi:hypothetical protein
MHASAQELRLRYADKAQRKLARIAIGKHQPYLLNVSKI